MARHLIVGDGTAYGVTSGLVDDGAVSVQKMSSSGPTELVAGDTIADAPQIRIIGGGSDGKDIVTPWIYGKDVVDWSGKVYTAAVAHRTDSTLTTSTAVTGTVTTKVIRIDTDEFDTFSFDTDYTTAVQTPTQIQVLVLAAWDAIAAADKPDWLNDTATVSSGVFRVTASKRGDTTNSGATWDEKNPIIEMVQTHSADTAQTHSNAIGVNMLPGYGEPYALKAFETELMGTSHGYYNRVQLPNAPTNQVSTSNTYDMYSLVATKDGSSNSQIHGVDNLIEINIGLKPGDADSAVVENKLNSYLASANFAPVIL